MCEEDTEFLVQKGYERAEEGWRREEREENILILKRAGSETRVIAKIIDERKADKNYLKKFFQREKEWMPRLSHPHIIGFVDLLQSGPKTFFIQELAEQGDYLRWMERRGKKRLDEWEAQILLKQLTEALYYIHRRWLVHRDIKSENIFIDKHGNVKLGDFGMIRYIKPNELSTTFCGSLVYAAPEIIACKKYHGSWADLYSLGIVLFIMLTGNLPYDEWNLPQMVRDKHNHKIDFPEFLSPEAQTLIQGLLHPTPIKRYRPCQVSHSHFLRHTPWIIYTPQGRIVKSSAPCPSTLPHS